MQCIWIIKIEQGLFLLPSVSVTKSTVASSLFTHKQLQLVLYRKIRYDCLSGRTQKDTVYIKKYQNIIIIIINVFLHNDIFHKTHKGGQSDDVSCCSSLTPDKEVLSGLRERAASYVLLSFCSLCINHQLSSQTLVPFSIWNSTQPYNKKNKQTNKKPTTKKRVYIYLASYYICFF